MMEDKKPTRILSRPHTALPYIVSMYSFIETRLFTRLVREYLRVENE